VWKPSRCSIGVRDFPRRETLCVFAAIYRATFFCTSRRRRHRGLSSACAWCPHFHAISGHLVSLTRRSWSILISPTTCKTFSKRRQMTKKTKNADRNRPEKTTPSCFAPDVKPGVLINNGVEHPPIFSQASLFRGFAKKTGNGEAARPGNGPGRRDSRRTAA